jgi:beta-phosphoglucomutase-like phosphatase (HAD superfamily)
MKVEKQHILFFDLDGTVIDTNYANFLSYKKAIDFITKSMASVEYKHDKRFNRTALTNNFPYLSENELAQIINAKEKYYADFLHETKLNEENAKILCKYFTTNKIVLVTNCRKDRALATLNYHGVMDKFSGLFFRQLDEHNTKVNKFQNAILSLDISPKLIIAFENEVEEIADAKKAGIQIINPKIL